MILFSEGLLAQDTIKVRRSGRGDEYCWVNVFAKGAYFKDSIPLNIWKDNGKAELRINEACPLKKKNDIFVTSFEIELTVGGQKQVTKIESSFFTDKLKDKILLLNKGDSFLIRNIVMHAPDGFRKMDELKIYIN